MTTKLGIYNQALATLGDSVPLASLEENRSARRFLDLQWDNGLVDFCLEQGQWGFATRDQKMTPSNSIIPEFGYQYAYQLPEDFVGLNSLWQDPEFLTPLNLYRGPDAQIIYTNQPVVYIRYTSNSLNYGNNMAAWPQSFTQYVIARLASQAQPLICNSPALNEQLERDEQKSKLTALNWDKRNKPRENLPQGNWSKARMGYWGYWGCGNW